MRNKTAQTHRLPWGMLRVFVVLMAMMAAFATDLSAQGTVKGKVSDETGEGLPGANVFVKGTTIGTITDMDGNYTIPGVPAGNQTITASFIGYQNMELVVSMSDGATITKNFTLREDNEELEEVVVIGYGVQKKKLVTGANAQVSGDDLAKMNTTNALQALQGQTAGVNIAATSGQPGEKMKVSVRGVGSLNGSDPLYIVDGVQTGDISYLISSL
ncbi:MAG: carboxypeptidase-like regulatory domain-containing protein [Bacteroidales bacterium]|nr:carboxypeptidase-like regulatory domain-containing protein [Bacteroidales bacterium]